MNDYQKRLLAAVEDDIRLAQAAIELQSYAGAISRAYYVMFHLAQAVLSTKELDYSKHSAVIGAFGREFAKSGFIDTKFHRYLIEAQDDRLKADYDVMQVLNLETAERHLNRAKEFLDATVRFLEKES